MSDSNEAGHADIGNMLALIVHDLRNPCATVTANVEFLRGLELPDVDACEALDDIAAASDDLKYGLILVGWIARWLSGGDALRAQDGDVVESVRSRCRGRAVEVTLPEQPILARGGGSIGDIVEVLLDNASRHVRGVPPMISVFAEGDEAVVRMVDAGTPVAGELRERVREPSAQSDLKGRGDGRYARYCGWLAAHAALRSVGGRLRFGGVPGAASFELRVPRV